MTKYSRKKAIGLTILAAALLIALALSLAVFLQQRNRSLPQADAAGAAVNDRIEIHNTGSEAVDLSGYGLSDDLTSAAKWTFPDGTVIEPGEQITIPG